MATYLSKMATRTRLPILLLLTVVILVVVSLYFTRLSLAGWGLRQILHHQGVAASLTVSDLHYDRLLIENLALGPGPDVTVETFELAFRPHEILSGKARAVTISGMKLHLDVTGDTIEVAGLPIRASEGVAGSDVRNVFFPDVTVRDSQFLVLTPLGEIEAEVSADIRNEESGTIALLSELSLTVDDFGNASGSVAATLGEGNRLFGDLRIEDGRLSLPEGEVAGLNGHLTYELMIDDLSSLVAQAEVNAAALTLRQPDLPISVFPEARISARVEGGRATIEGNLAVQGGSLRGKTRVALANFLDGGSVEGETSLRIEAPSPLPTAFGLPEPDQGTLDMDISFTGQTPGVMQTFNSPNRLLSRLLTEGLVLRAHAVLDDLSVPGWLGLAKSELSIAGTLNQDALAIETQGPASLALSGLNDARLMAAGLPPSVITLVQEGLAISSGTAEEQTTFVYEHSDDTAKVTMNGPLSISTLVGDITYTSSVSLALVEGRIHDISVKDIVADVPYIPFPGDGVRDLRIYGNASGNLGDLSADLLLYGTTLATNLGTLAVEQTQFEIPLSALIDPAAVHIKTKSGAKIELHGLSGAAELTALEPFIFEIEELEAKLPRSDLTTVEIFGRGTLDETSLQAQFDRVPIKISTSPIVLQVSGGEIGQPKSEFHVQFISDSLNFSGKYPADLSGITGRFRIDADTMGLTADFSILDANLEALDRVILPFGVDVEVSLDEGGQIELRATPIWKNGLSPLSLRGEIEPASQKASLRAELSPLTFSPGGLQPKDLSPLAKHFEKVAGTIAGNASLDWQGNRLESSGRLTVYDGSFTSTGVTVVGLSTELALKSLWPLETSPSQLLFVEKLDIGVPLSNFETVFAARSRKTGASIVSLDKSSFEMLGSKINLRPQTYDAQAEETPFVIDVSHLDLAELFAFIGVEGMDGSGTIYGTIPMKISRKGVDIMNGRLINVEPGRLQIRSDTVRAYLANYDENVDLLMEALEDFHYETLTLEIDKTASEDLIARLSVLGRNPNVLEGRSFQLNIQLDSNIEQLMDAMFEGYRISNEALKRAWGLTR